MEQPTIPNYSQAINAIKQAILRSRYQAAASVNKEMLALYYGIGRYISQNSRKHYWGANALSLIADQLQSELPGIRGFSETNMKKMRTFFEEWQSVFEFRPLTTDEITFVNDSCQQLSIRPLTTDELTPETLRLFTTVGFTHHYELLLKTRYIDERLFYIQKCATEFWSVEKLKYNLKSNLYQQQGSITCNFTHTITNKDLRKAAMLSFKDEYLIDFVNVEDPDEADERELESEIVLHIKKFIMALGNDYSFIGNQYRMEVDGKEYFIDLLFFNRRIQSLVAIELKRGEFKPEYAGKLNFYLSALDAFVKLPHENPSIGIILCKSQHKTTVEFAFQDTNKPMGVATYKLANDLPIEYANILPKAEDLKNLLENTTPYNG